MTAAGLGPLAPAGETQMELLVVAWLSPSLHRHLANITEIILKFKFPIILAITQP